VRRYRDEHHRALAVRRRDAAAARNDDARARDAGRAKLAMALRRGTLERGRCRECGAREVVGLIADPAEWRAVVWVCREHRQAELERRRDAAAQRTANAKQAAWYDERTRALAAIELLPPAQRARLHALAARGPAGTQLSPGAPLYVMNLVRVYKARIVTIGAMWEAFALRRETIEEFPGREHRRDRINQIAQVPIARNQRLHATRAR